MPVRSSLAFALDMRARGTNAQVTRGPVDRESPSSVRSSEVGRDESTNGQQRDTRIAFTCTLLLGGKMGNGGSTSNPRWAADPSGRHAFRYWDGSRWTGHVADSAVAPSRAPKGTEPPGTPVSGPPAVTKVAEPQAPSKPESPAVVATAEVVAEVAEEHHESRRRERRQATRRRKAFLVGLLTGAGVVLIGAAVAVVGFKVKVNSNSSSSKHRAATTTTVVPTSLATTTTSNPGRAPQQVRVEVINASGLPNAAGAKAIGLGRLGYQNAGLADAAVRQGTAVQCKPGFEAEAGTLSKAVGPGTTVEPFPSPPPVGSTN